ncbi:MAG: SpoIVB peptidase [Erysipelotrichaceae bacterium]|nr:SpoIVB peptidase [Erysipelotrichaceae bacterium]
MKALIISIILSLMNSFTDISKQVISLIPGGENIGVEIRANGVVVIGGYDVYNESIKYNPCKDSDIKKGDLIYQVNNEDINNIQELLNIIERYQNDRKVTLSILRNNNPIKKELKLIKMQNVPTFKTGLLVKERLLGIGTITFYDPESKIYGALGHKLVDNDFSSIADINSGTIFESKVTSIHKSSIGNVGELIASIDEDNVLGDVFANTEYGIFGYYDYSPDKDALEIARHDEVKLGKATIFTTLHDNIVEQYDIEITSLMKQDTLSTKGISFKIIDKELLKETGGIVQGMSGSPIIQNEKIVGAVTHVLVDSVKKGYGIYIDFMMEAAKMG